MKKLKISIETRYDNKGNCITSAYCQKCHTYMKSIKSYKDQIFLGLESDIVSNELQCPSCLRKIDIKLNYTTPNELNFDVERNKTIIKIINEWETRTWIARKKNTISIKCIDCGENIHSPLDMYIDANNFIYFYCKKCNIGYRLFKTRFMTK